MNVDNHLRAIKEGFEAIKWAIDQGIEETQTTIAFHCSNIAVNMLEIYLRKKNKITPGHIVKHEWFKSKNKTRKNLEFEFEKKKEILELMHNIEEKRNILCYGKKQKAETINQVLENLYKLKDIFIKLGLNELKQFD